MHPRPLLSAALLCSVAALGSDAHALTPRSAPVPGTSAEGLELSPSAVGLRQAEALRIDEAPLLSWSAPGPRQAKALAKLRARLGPAWRVGFDPSTGVARRAYGPGLLVPGSIASAELAEKAALDLLSEHLELLSPGASLSDFELVANELDQGQRTLGFVQRHGGLRVRGGQLSVRFKNDRLYALGSEAVPHLRVPSPSRWASEAELVAGARSFVDGALGLSSTLLEPPGAAEILSLRVGARRIHHVVVPVVLEVDSPRLRYRVYVDAETGEPIAREQLLRFAEATVSLLVPERAPGHGPRFAAPAALAQATIDGSAATASALGALGWVGAAAASVELVLEGSLVRVRNSAGAPASLSVELDDGEAYVWDASAEAELDAELSTYAHAGIVKSYAKRFAPSLAYLDKQLRATVNIDDACNAYSDGTTINFYRAGQGCENTGRIADVVYHEFGHSLHNQSIVFGVGDFDGALSEGISDYLAATITGDPAMGRGFFGTSQELRHIDPAGQERRWPEDVTGQVHTDGLIIGQALWDMRKALVLELGEAEGVATSDHLFYQGIRRASDIPTMHFEVLAADDDDGDISNGTPHACAINRAFNLHGMSLRSATSAGLGVVPREASGLRVEAEVTGLFDACPEDTIASARLSYREAGSSVTAATIEMERDGVKLAATLPAPEGGTLLEYSIEVDFASGSAPVRLPDNPAAPRYQVYVGDVVPLYCTSFETDPELDGWTHGLSDGTQTEGADDWQWGPPGGNARNGDPSEAFEGERVFGNDLAVEPNFNGLYQADKVTWAKTPVIDASGYAEVRLQYRRWLNVEDAFFDRASIYAGDKRLWRNFDSDQGDQSTVHHRDREWRFHDVDLSDAVDDDGTVQVTYELSSDAGFELGGWTLDAFCIVGVTPKQGTCTDCTPPPDPGGVDALDDPLAASGGCGCSTPLHPAGPGSACAAATALALSVALRRRRRRS